MKESNKELRRRFKYEGEVDLTKKPEELIRGEQWQLGEGACRSKLKDEKPVGTGSIGLQRQRENNGMEGAGEE